MNEIGTEMAGKTLDFPAVTAKIAEMLTKGEQNSLPSAMIKGSGIGFYYSLVDKRMIPVQKRGELYLLPLEKDEKGRFYVFSPGLFGSGMVVLVPEDELILIGFQ